jgi:hypothetical protein
VIQGEDAVAYDELLARLRAAVNPTDVIDEIFVKDFADLEWEVLRLRRMKTSLVRMWGLRALKNWLPDHLGFERCADQILEQLTDFLRQHLPEDKAETLATEFVRGDGPKDKEVYDVIEKTDVELADIYRPAKEEVAAELVQNYATSRPDAVSEIVSCSLTTAIPSMICCPKHSTAPNLSLPLSGSTA